MNVLTIGDVVGRAGRDALKELLPGLKREFAADLTIVNGENAAQGKCVTPETADEIFKFGADVITSGNHVWNNKKVLDYLEREERLLRPANYPHGAKGAGSWTGTVKGKRIVVINLIGRLFMDAVDCPFRKFDELFAEHRQSADLIAVDFHAEATSEKRALGFYVDGRASLVYGTHTHVQTADEEILPKGTGYISDLGMTGSFDSIIGMQKEIAIGNFLTQTKTRLEVASGKARINGALFRVGEDGQTESVIRINRAL